MHNTVHKLHKQTIWKKDDIRFLKLSMTAVKQDKLSPVNHLLFPYQAILAYCYNRCRFSARNKMSNISRQYMFTSLCINILWKNSTCLRTQQGFYWCTFSRGRPNLGLEKPTNSSGLQQTSSSYFSDVILAYNVHRNPYEGHIRTGS